MAKEIENKIRAHVAEKPLAPVVAEEE
jgi:hypothetical protein